MLFILCWQICFLNNVRWVLNNVRIQALPYIKLPELEQWVNFLLAITLVLIIGDNRTYYTGCYEANWDNGKWLQADAPHKVYVQYILASFTRLGKWNKNQHYWMEIIRLSEVLERQISYDIITCGI